MKIVIQMDDPARLNPKLDSTIALAMAAQSRGYELLYYTPYQLSQYRDKLCAVVRPIYFYEQETEFFHAEQSYVMDLEQADILLIRQEPPYNMQYLTTCWLLSQLKKPLIVNNPTALFSRPEKLFALELPQYMPPSLISRNKEALRDFLVKHNIVVIKPLYSFGGQGVLRISASDCNWNSLIDMLLTQSHEPIMMQQFLPQVYDNESRVLLIDGKIAAAFNRIPAEGEIRVNSACGGSFAKTTLSHKQQEICHAVGNICRRDGLFFVGVDLIGDTLIEVNTTCPTGIRAYQQLTAANIADKFWDELESKITKLASCSQ